MSVEYPTKLYEFISGGYDWERNVIYIKAQSASEALYTYCKWYDVTDYRLEAIMSVPFESALKLANEWLDHDIFDIHEVGNTIYSNEKYAPQIIE